ERLQHYAQRCSVDVSCHRLRHTYGRWLAEGEMPVLALRRLLGHASIQTSQRYIDGADPQVRRSYEAAMERQSLTQAEHPPLPDLLPAPSSATASVTRPAPLAVDATSWLPEAPDGVRQGVVAWLSHQAPRWKPSQRRHHTQKRLGELRQFWLWQLRRRSFRDWADLTSADMAAFMDAELARGLHPTTLKSILDRVYTVLRYLADQGDLATLPARLALRLPDPLPRHLAPQEVLAIEARLERCADRPSAEARLNRALYYLLSHAGLRISEVLELQVQDLDLAARRVRVRDGKGRRDRVVFVSAQTAEELGQYLRSVTHAAADLEMRWQGRPLRYEDARAL